MHFCWKAHDQFIWDAVWSCGFVSGQFACAVQVGSGGREICVGRGGVLNGVGWGLQVVTVCLGFPGWGSGVGFVVVCCGRCCW